MSQIKTMYLGGQALEQSLDSLRAAPKKRTGKPGPGEQLGAGERFGYAAPPDSEPCHGCGKPKRQHRRGKRGHHSGLSGARPGDGPQRRRRMHARTHEPEG